MKHWFLDHRPRELNPDTWVYGASWGAAIGVSPIPLIHTTWLSVTVIGAIFVFLIVLGKYAHAQHPLVSEPEPENPYESEEYAKFVDSMAEHCRCTGQVCGGVLAGGMCDEIIEDEA